MSTTRNLMTLVVTAALPLLYLVGVSPDAPAGFW